MTRHLFFICLLFGVLTGTAAAQEDASPVPVLIDTDFAADDWLAILYLLQHPGADVRAITLTGAGEAHCDPGIQNALNLLALAGKPDIPVACGRESPIEGDREFPSEWRAAVDSMLGISLPTSGAAPYDGDAVALLREQITASDEPPVLITLGPLTNVADLFAADPALVDAVADVVIMGGAVSVPGNVWLGDGSAEWNVYVDPLAADQVIQSGVPVTLVPLDATNHVPLTRDFLNAVRGDRTTPTAEFVFHVLAAQSGFIQSGGYYFWDPLAAALALDRSLGTFQGRPIRVITGGGQDSGRTAADGRGAPVEVAVNADGARFAQMFRNVLNGRPVDAPLPEASIEAEPESANAALVRSYFEEGWAGPESPVVDELLDPAYTLIGNDANFVGGIDSLKGTIAGLYTFMPDATVEVEALYDAGDTIAARVILSGTLSNPELGELATGAPVVLALHSLVRIENGRIIEEWHGVDISPLLYALNAVKPEVMQQMFDAVD